LILRPARAGDAEAICAIQNPIIRDTLITFTTVLRTPEAVAAEITEKGAAFLVAEIDGQVAGFASFGEFRKGPGYAATREHSVNLAPDARGRGVGQALMARLEHVAAAQGVHVLIGGVSGANPAGIAFHERIGFTCTGRLPGVGFKQGQWLDLVLMQKHLRPETAPDRGGGAG